MDMDLKTYLSSLEKGGAAQLAKELGVSRSFLSQMASGAAKVSPARCIQIEVLTKGVVSRRTLRKDWMDIWPEMKDVA